MRRYSHTKCNDKLVVNRGASCKVPLISRRENEMKVREIVDALEYGQDVHVWDVSSDDTAALYEGAPDEIPSHLLDVDVTGIYVGNEFLGIDLD